MIDLSKLFSLNLQVISSIDVSNWWLNTVQYFYFKIAICMLSARPTNKKFIS